MEEKPNRLSKRRIIFFCFIAVVFYVGIRSYVTTTDGVNDTEMVLFDRIEGPDNTSTVLPESKSILNQFKQQSHPSKLAVFITDTNSSWLGMVQCLKNAGISFFLTTKLDEALPSKAIYIYPYLSGNVIQASQFETLHNYVNDGGILIAQNILGGGFQDLFGYETMRESKKHSAWTVTAALGRKQVFPYLKEGFTLRFANPKLYPNNFPTVSYEGATSVLMRYENGSPFFIEHSFGKGKGYAIGMDLGHLALRCGNARGFAGYKKFANGFEPGTDAVFAVIKFILKEKNAVFLRSSYGKSDLSVLVTHDIDFTRSIRLVDKYAELERNKHVLATYFIQTKYIKDWNDDIFYTKKNIEHLKTIREMGMEIGSHSVSHSHIYSKFKMGKGDERYPEYRPFVMDRYKAKNGTILGEIRVSKFLLEHFVPNVKVTAFRPGHLQYPFQLPQALVATGIHNSSTTTANDVFTHYPFFLTYDRAYASLLDVLEIPVTIEDELELPLMKRLKKDIEVAEKIAQYGGVYNMLIHTDRCGDKLVYQKKLMEALEEKSNYFTVSSFGAWWRQRNGVEWSVEEQKDGSRVLVITTKNSETVSGLTFEFLEPVKLAENQDGVSVEGKLLFVDGLTKKRRIKLK